MNLPFVSRLRLDAAHERIGELRERVAQLESERDGLIARLLAMPAREPEPSKEAVEQGIPAAFSTPFDRVEKQFEQAFRGKSIPPKFKARAS